MNNTLASKLLSVVSVVLLAVGAVAAIVVFVTGDDAYIDLLLYWTYALAVFAFAAIIILSIINMLRSRKSTLSLVLVLAIAAVVVFGLHAITPNTLPTFFGVEAYNLTISTSKWIDTALYVTYFLFGVSVMGLVFTAIRAAFLSKE